MLQKNCHPREIYPEQNRFHKFFMGKNRQDITKESFKAQCKEINR